MSEIIYIDDVIRIYKLLLSKKITKSVSFDVGTGKSQKKYFIYKY